jgi:hypothetical protein
MPIEKKDECNRRKCERRMENKGWAHENTTLVSCEEGTENKHTIFETANNPAAF